MGLINPYSQPELEEKGWEFSSEDVKVKPDDGSVSEASLDDDLKTRMPKVYNFKNLAVPAKINDGYESITVEEWQRVTGYPDFQILKDIAANGWGYISTSPDSGTNGSYFSILGVSKYATPVGSFRVFILLKGMNSAGGYIDILDYFYVSDDDVKTGISRIRTTFATYKYFGGTLGESAMYKELVSLLDKQIPTDKIGDGAVTGAKISSGAVTGAKISSGAVTQAKIGASAVVTDKIKDSAVTQAKLSDDLQTAMSSISDLIAGGYVYDPSISLTSIPNVAPYNRFFFNRVSYNTTTYGIQVCKVAAGSKDIKYAFTWVEYPLGVQWETGNIKNSAITGIKIAAGAVGMSHLDAPVKTAITNTPKQYELTTTLDNETDTTPEAFLAKYGVSVDVIKGLRVGDSLHVDSAGETYGVVAKYDDSSVVTIQLAETTDELGIAYMAAVQVTTTDVRVVTYNLLRSGQPQSVLDEFTYAADCNWGETYEGEDIENQTNQPVTFWESLSIGMILSLNAASQVFIVTRMEPDATSTIFYLGMYNEPQTDGTAKQIQYSIRLRYNSDRTALTSISFYADEIETGGGSGKNYNVTLPWGGIIPFADVEAKTGLTVDQWQAVSDGDTLTVVGDANTYLQIYKVVGVHSYTDIIGSGKQLDVCAITPAASTYTIVIRIETDDPRRNRISFNLTNRVRISWGNSMPLSAIEYNTFISFSKWVSLEVGQMLEDTETPNYWIIQRKVVTTNGCILYLGCFNDTDEARANEFVQYRVILDETGGNNALTFEVTELPTPYVPVEYTLPTDFPYNATVSKRYVSDVIGTVANGSNLNEGDVFVYGNNRYKIVSKSTKPSSAGDYKNYSFCFECSTFNGNGYGQSGATGYGGLFFSDGGDGCVVYTVQYDKAPASSESLIDDVQWAATGQKAGFVMLSGEPTGTIEPLPYNRIWAEMYTAGTFDTPTINIKVIFANSTTKTTAIGYSFAGNIGTPCLRANCVTTAKIANKAVSADKLGNDVFASKIYALTQDLIFDTRYTPATYNAAFGMLFDVWADYVDGTGKAPVLTAAGTGSQVKKYVAGTVSAAGANRWMIDLGCVYDVDTSAPVRAYAILEWDEADAEWDAITFKKG